MKCKRVSLVNERHCMRCLKSARASNFLEFNINLSNEKLQISLHGFGINKKNQCERIKIPLDA
jgi:hypothetical protein